MGLRIFLRDWNDFAADTELKLDLDNFCPKRREKGNWNFLSKKAERGKGVGLEIICPSKKGEG